MTIQNLSNNLIEIFMDELLVFSNNKTGDNVGIYYNTWLFIIKCILAKYLHKTSKEIDEILSNV